MTADPWRGSRGVRTWASGTFGKCVLVYMNDCLVHLPMLEQLLLYVAEVLEIFRRDVVCSCMPRASCVN